MNRILLAGLFLCLPLFATSCLRTSTVVKVRENGSGEIISRYYFSPQVDAFLTQMEAVGNDPDINLLDAGPMPDFALIRGIISPDKESLVADAENYGEGVTYSKHEQGKDAEGWGGYTVVYEFDDIRTVKIDQDAVPGKAQELIEQAGEEFNGGRGGGLTFDLEGKKLTVKSSLTNSSVEEMMDEEQIAQVKQMGMKPSEAMLVAAASTEGMRAGIFLRIEPDIAETDAEHVTGNLIILSDAEVAKVMRDPDFGAFADQVAEDPSVVTEESVRELYGKIEALTIETSEEIEVLFP